MKDLNHDRDLKEEIKEVREIQQESKQEYIGSITPHKGHTLFEINLDTKGICEATFEEQEVEFNPNGGVIGSTRKKVVMNPNCIYISALNKNNAVKKFLRKRNGSK